MTGQPMNVALLITADASQATRGVKEAERGIEGLGAAAKASAGGVNSLAAANDLAAAASRRAAQAAIGQSQAEVEARKAAAAATTQLRMQTQNLAFQFQDIATMMVAGQNPFMLLSQQLPQVTMHGGRLTGVMTALKQTLAGFVSPLGLLTTGFVLAGSAALSYFSDVEDEAANAELTLDEQRTLIRQVADEWGGLVPALRAYAEELERADKAGKLTQATQVAIAAQFDEAALSTGAAKTAIGETIGELLRLNQAAAQGDIRGLRDDFNEFDRAAQDLAKALKEGGDTAAGFERFQRALSDLMGNEAVQASDTLRAAIEALRDAYSEAASAAGKFAEQNAAAQLGASELPTLGAIPPVFSGGGGFINEDEVQTARADAAKSQFQKEQEKAARRGGRSRKTDAQRDAERYDQIVGQAERAIEMEMLEAEALGMTREAADRLRITQELLNQARAAGISLSPEQVAELTALGAAMAEVTAEVQAQADAMDLRRDVLTDVIGGIREAARDGKITLQELADIGMRVLDRLIDKIQKDLIAALTEVGGLGGNSGGGVLGSILGALGLGGGGGATAASMNAISPAAAGVIRSGGAGLFDAGGYTGRGNPARVAGLVHEEEYVFSAPAVRSIGLGTLERMHRTAKGGRGFAEGGYTGGGAAGSSGAGAPGWGGGPLVSVEVINNSSGTRVREEKSSAPGGRELRRILVEDIKGEMAGGGFDDVMGSRYSAGVTMVPR